MSRQLSNSTASDASSTYSVSTTYTEKPLLGEPLEARRGLRQKARDVVSDLGKPPTSRQDAKEGKHTSNFVESGFMTELARTTKI